jgi:hypothetical protein
MRYSFSILVMIVLMLSVSDIQAQSSVKSSGVIELNISKKKQDEPVKPQRNVSSATFTPTITNKPEKQISLPPPSGNTGNSVRWISPAFNTINTSQGTYDINAEVISKDPLRVANIFVNDQFSGNEIAQGGYVMNMEIKETVDLKLGGNVVRVEGISVSGNKVVDEVFINYDISTARYYALIIAVQDYDDPSINDLDQPIDDASRFYKVINSRYTFKEEDITFLKNPTKSDIIGTLHSMRGMINEEDNLLIYYAGHGYWDEEMETGYWLPRDADSDNPVNWLPNTDLTNYLNALNSKHTLLIADACFSGAIFKTRAAFNNSAAIEKLYQLPSRKAMTSGTLTEVPDQSDFIYYLLQGLQNNNKKYLNSELLFSEIKPRILDNSDYIPQYGTIQKVGDEGGDFVFILK